MNMPADVTASAVAAGEHDIIEILNAETDAGVVLQNTGAGTVAYYSEKRPGKTTANEDSLGIIPLNNDDCVLLVADGMGGMPCGDQASRLAVEQISLSLQDAEETESGYRTAVLNGIDAAHDAIVKLAVGAGSTVAMVEIWKQMARAYHVGDSEILVVGQRGKVKFQSIPHSPVGYAVQSGMLDQSEALHHDDRHIISNFLGDAEMSIEIGFNIKLARFDTVLIASDGLFDNLYLNEIIDIIRKGRLRRAGEKLAQLVNARMLGADSGHPSKPDDVSFILFRRSG